MDWTHWLVGCGSFMTGLGASVLKIRRQSTELKAFRELWAEAGAARVALGVRCDSLEKRVELCEQDRAAQGARIAVLEDRQENRLTRHPERDIRETEEDE